MFRFIRSLFLISISSIGFSQTNTSSAKPDPAILLHEVAQEYSQAKYYRIEGVREVEFKGELSRQWDKSIIASAVAPNNRYRFEGRTDHGWNLKVSDGRTEWIFDRLSKMYTQKPSPESGPSPVKGPIFLNQMAIIEAQDLIRNLHSALNNILDPVYLDDETVSLSDKEVPCYVIRGRAHYRGGSRDTRGEITVWIDRETHLVRKMHSHTEGAIMTNLPDVRFVGDQNTVYPVADLGPSSSPDEVFKFEPPAGAKLVDEFPNPMKPGSDLPGKMAPNVKLEAADGKTVQLSGFRGKPVLLDFWATWCAPCVESFPAVEKIYQETVGKGLTLISIDEDEEAKVAAEFWAKRAEAWSNFHDPDGGIQREFAAGGIPQFVLIDSAGKITYASSGLDEPALRSAIARLGPDFAPLEARPQPKE